VEKYYIVSRQPVTNFVGREDQLQQILEYFGTQAAQTPPKPKVLILCALGGQGKSQIALEYCRRSRPFYRGIFWIHANSEQVALQSYGIIVQQMNIALVDRNDSDALKRLVKTRLESWDERWLMVFDNYDEPYKFDGIREFMPEGRRFLTLLSQLC